MHVSYFLVDQFSNHRFSDELTVPLHKYIFEKNIRFHRVSHDIGTRVDEHVIVCVWVYQKFLKYERQQTVGVCLMCTGFRLGNVEKRLGKVRTDAYGFARSFIFWLSGRPI